MESMAEVKIKNLNNVKKSIVELFNEIRKDEKLLLDIGNETVRMTKGFLRSGKSPKDKKPLPALEDETIEQKKRMKSHNSVAKYYGDGLSNLSFTGQLIDSIEVVSIDREKSIAKIDVTDNAKRKPYKLANGKSVKDTPTNSQIYQWLGVEGINTKSGYKKWDFFGINKQMENVINKIVRKFMNDKIKKNFNNKK